MVNSASSKLLPLVEPLRQGLWLVGMSAWIFGITDRSIAAFSDGHLTASELVQLSIASLVALGWYFLKPNRK
ncbi:MAG: hypothetical protein HC895_05580 [Leptolyngbyaceae cyanobacterium SM1_3_5]|nr:hypothetical protein [Leptolyngbyaceae cyanobacterium SM1_3_5]